MAWVASKQEPLDCSWECNQHSTSLLDVFALTQHDVLNVSSTPFLPPPV